MQHVSEPHGVSGAPSPASSGPASSPGVPGAPGKRQRVAGLLHRLFYGWISRFFLGYIRRTFYFLVIAAVLPSLAIILFSGLDRRETEMLGAQERANELIYSLGLQQRQIIGQAYTLLSTLGTAFSLVPDPEFRQVLLTEAFTINKEFLNTLFVVGADGIVQTDPRSLGSGVSPGHISAIDQAIKTRAFAVGDFGMDHVTSRAVIDCAFPVINFDNSIDSVLVARLKLGDFSMKLASGSTIPGTVLMLLDKNGIVLHSSVRSYYPPGLAVNLTKAWGAILSSPDDTGIISEYLKDDRSYIVAYSRLRHQDNPEPYITIVLALRKEVLYKQARVIMQRDIILLALATGLATLVAFLLGRETLARPVERLVHLAQSLRSGHKYEQGSLAGMGGEIGQLVTSFDAMATAIENRDAQLTAAFQRADAANQAKTEFLASISHEMRTPLHVIMGLADLARETELSVEQWGYVHSMHEAAASLLGIISDTLDLSRIERDVFVLERIPFTIHNVIEKTWPYLKNRAEAKGVSCDFSVDSLVPPVILGDPLRLGQILNNLVGNAIKFTEKGTVELLVTCAAPPRPSREGQDTVALRFTVRDTGIGLSDSQVKKLFVPFSQAEASTFRKYGGTGMGLFIVRSLVDRMGGSVAVTSGVGKGTEISVTVPFGVGKGGAEDLTAWETPLSGHVSSIKSSGSFLADSRILLVDDNLMNQHVMQAILVRAGAHVTLASSGEEALKILAAGGPVPTFDVVLLDIQMPGLDGYETFARIRRHKKWAAMPVIAVSAQAMVGEREKAISAGMDDYLFKPISVSTLLEALRHWVGQKDSSAKPLKGKKSRQTALARHQGDGGVIAQHQLPAHVQEKLPALPGFDLVFALKSLDYDVELYERMVLLFVRYVAVEYRELPAALARNEYDTAARIVHTVKGMAASLGIVRLIGCGKDYENALRENKGDSALPREAFFAALQESLAVIAAAYPALWAAEAEGIDGRI